MEDMYESAGHLRPPEQVPATDNQPPSVAHIPPPTTTKESHPSTDTPEPPATTVTGEVPSATS